MLVLNAVKGRTRAPNTGAAGRSIHTRIPGTKFSTKYLVLQMHTYLGTYLQLYEHDRTTKFSTSREIVDRVVLYH